MGDMERSRFHVKSTRALGRTGRTSKEREGEDERQGEYGWNGRNGDGG